MSSWKHSEREIARKMSEWYDITVRRNTAYDNADNREHNSDVDCMDEWVATLGFDGVTFESKYRSGGFKTLYDIVELIKFQRVASRNPLPPIAVEFSTMATVGRDVSGLWIFPFDIFPYVMRTLRVALPPTFVEDNMHLMSCIKTIRAKELDTAMEQSARYGKSKNLIPFTVLRAKGHEQICVFDPAILPERIYKSVPRLHA